MKVRVLIQRAILRAIQDSASALNASAELKVSRQGEEIEGDLVRERGLEPLRACAHKVLSLARLPFRHSRWLRQEYSV